MDNAQLVIPDPELRRFASSEDTDERRSVIIELSAKPPRLSPRETVPRPRAPEQGRGTPREFADLEEDEALSQLAGQLAALGLADDLVRLNAAQAFVATVSPAQLRATLRLPQVGVIRPNRTHRAAPTR